MVQSGIPFDLQQGTARQFKLIASYLELSVSQDESAEGGASRAKKVSEPEEPEIISQGPPGEQ